MYELKAYSPYLPFSLSLSLPPILKGNSVSAIFLNLFYLTCISVIQIDIVKSKVLGYSFTSKGKVKRSLTNFVLEGNTPWQVYNHSHGV